MERNRRFDWITREVSLQMAHYYLPAGNLTEPLASPLYGDLHGLPPLYIQAGEAEVLHDQIHAFASRAREQGVDVLLEMFPGMVHEFQAFDRYTQQSRAALTRIGKVIDHRLDRGTW
jgi:acetyl esterase/lipase